MERGLGAERDTRRLDQQYGEARRAVDAVADRLRTTVDGWRERLADEPDAIEGPDGAAQAAEAERFRSDLARLELAAAHLERTRDFLGDRDAPLSPRGNGSLPTDVQVAVVEAQEAERQRLAQEIHDGPAQALTNAIFQVEYIERLLDRDPVAARGEMRFLRDRLRRELADVRTFITQLRPPLLDEIGLYGAIRDHADSLAEATGTEVDIDLAAPPEALGDTQQTVILRIVQEALQNIRRHAHARYVRIVTRLDQADSASGRDWVLEITDDGRGFDPAQVAGTRGARSFGLRFMRERADLIGAQLDIASRPDGGTRIRVFLPGGTERR